MPIKFNEISLSQLDPVLRHSQIFSSDVYIPYGLKAYDHRIFYTLEGSIVMKVNGRKHYADRGTLLMWPPGTGYSLIASESELSKVMTFNFDLIRKAGAPSHPVPPDPESSFLPGKILDPSIVRELNTGDPVLSMKVSQEVENILLSIKNEFVTGKTFSLDKSRGLLIVLFCVLASELITGIKRDSDISQLDPDLVLDYLKLNFATELNNGSVGRHFSFHPNYISRVIKKSTGMPLHKYLIRLRISEAINMLQTTEMNVSEVAAAVGFSNINYFSRCFRKHTGSPPGKWKIGGTGVKPPSE